jgi:hypothetical protein
MANLRIRDCGDLKSIFEEISQQPLSTVNAVIAECDTKQHRPSVLLYDQLQIPVPIPIPNFSFRVE